MHIFVIMSKYKMDYIEDRHEYYNVYISKCTQCKHFNFDKLKVHDKRESDQKGEFVFLKESN